MIVLPAYPKQLLGILFDEYVESYRQMGDQNDKKDTHKEEACGTELRSLNVHGEDSGRVETTHESQEETNATTAENPEIR